MIRFYKPTIRRKDMNAVLQTMVDEKIGPGERKRQFAGLLSQQLGKSHCVPLRSYVDAIRLSYVACQVGNGSLVGMSVLSPEIHRYAATMLGASVLLGDVDPATGCLSADEAKRLEGEGCCCVILDEPVGMIPYQQDYSSLSVPLIEDVTQSIGSVYDTEKAGSRGKILVSAFEEPDVISAAGGAAILTNDQKIRDAVLSSIASVRPFLELPDLNAALGIIQCETFPEQLEKRRTFYRLFQKGLLKTHHKLFGITNPEFEINGYGFAVQLDSKIEEVMDFATRYQVSTRRTFASCVGADKVEDFDHFPVAIPAILRCVSFPIYPFISQADSDVLLKVISHLP